MHHVSKWVQLYSATMPVPARHTDCKLFIVVFTSCPTEICTPSYENQLHTSIWGQCRGEMHNAKRAIIIAGIELRSDMHPGHLNFTYSCVDIKESSAMIRFLRRRVNLEHKKTPNIVWCVFTAVYAIIYRSGFNNLLLIYAWSTKDLADFGDYI